MGAIVSSDPRRRGRWRTRQVTPHPRQSLYMSLGAAVGSDFPAFPTQLGQSLARLAHQFAFGREGS
jgi:hypothetical protein